MSEQTLEHTLEKKPLGVSSIGKLEGTNIFSKIQKIADQIKNLEKDMVVGTGQYSYKAVSDYQVTLAVKEAERENKVVSVPFKQELISSETHKLVKKGGDEGLMFVENIKMTVRIVDLESGEYLDVDSFGKGVDMNDKGFGKASTYARKYALLNAYKIATGEDPDAIKSEQSIGQKTISDKRKAVVDYLELNEMLKNDMIDHFNVSSLDKLTDKQIETIHSTYKKKNLI